jgi:hypothetical protein
LVGADASFDKSPRKTKTKRRTKAMATNMTMMTIKMMMATRSDVCSNLSHRDSFGGDQFWQKFDCKRVSRWRMPYVGSSARFRRKTSLRK